MQEIIPNVLAGRYISDEIRNIFTETGKTIAERDLWIAVMKAQKELGVNIPAEDIEQFERAKENVNLNLIKEIEKKTKHDVKAKIEAFVQAAGAGEHIHKGMTSRDLTDNVEQMQIKKASEIIFGKYVAVLARMIDKAMKYNTTLLTARTHHQAAQPTLLGRRFSMWAEELHYHLENFEGFIQNYPLRGIKGPVGTQFDMLTLLGSMEKVNKLEEKVANLLGFQNVLQSTGQVYPRSLDYAFVSNLALLSAAPENFAKTMRLMSGYELVTEGFKGGQVGSSAMPHKMNTAHSERICGLSEMVKMYADGVSRISGDQWEEGDVSCSSPRRIVIPDSIFASDGLCETTLDVLRNMGAYPVMISKEVDRYLPFLATTEILMTAVKAGIGRETAHEIIKKYAIQEALNMRREGSDKNNLPELLAKDETFAKAGITSEKIYSILSDREHFIGNAWQQIKGVRLKTKPIFERYQKESQYMGKEIL